MRYYRVKKPFVKMNGRRFRESEVFSENMLADVDITRLLNRKHIVEIKLDERSSIHLFANKELARNHSRIRADSILVDQRGG